MFDDYFSYWDDLPADGGITLFGAAHIIWLLVITGTVIFGARYYRNKEKEDRRKWLRVLAFVMIGMEIYRYSILTIIGHMEVQYLPLQLCNLAVIIEIVYAFVPCTFLGELMCTACLPGAAAALIFPDWTRYPVINFMSLHGFIMHGLLVLIPCMLMVARDFVPKLKHIYMVALFFVVTLPIIKVINYYFDTNFMFLERPSRGSPFQAVYHSHGYVSYMVVYGMVVFAIILLMYGVSYLMTGKYHNLGTDISDMDKQDIANI